MSKHQIRQIIERKLKDSGVIKTRIKGVELFRITESMRCAPIVYKPNIVAIVSGEKEAILGGKRYIYDSNKYMCCPVILPVEAGTPNASPDYPLLGVYISIDTKVMSELALKLDTSSRVNKSPQTPVPSTTLKLANWDTSFTEALLRLLELEDSPESIEILGESRIRELYYSVLKGDAGHSVRRAFGIDNDIARTIKYLSAHLHEPIAIEDLTERVGMSRAVFHRKFKQATMMSPIQFIKSMRLNSAAMKIAGGMNVSEAALNVGYVSSSQFSREFKRLYGLSPKQWHHSLTPHQI